MVWYKDGTLIDIIEKIKMPIEEHKKMNEKSFRMVVDSYHKIKGVGDVISGKVVQGSITPGNSVKFTNPL